MELFPTLKLGWPNGWLLLGSFYLVFGIMMVTAQRSCASNRQDGSPSSATLLEQLLALVRQGGVRSIGEVAEELGASSALVETMLEDLARRGYLRPSETQCTRTCAGCALAGQCAVTGGGRVWQIEAPGGQ